MISAEEINITHVGSALWGDVNDFDIRGDYAFLAMGHGLMVLDISDPEYPTEVSRSFFGDRGPRSIDIEGGYAYVSRGIEPAYIVDISDVYAPQIIGSYQAGCPVDEIIPHGDYAFLVHGCGTVILDITDRANPDSIGGVFLVGPIGVTISGNLAFLYSFDGVMILDMTDPSSPVELSVFETDEYPRLTTVDGDYAYLTCGYDGLIILDVSDPANPVQVGQYGSSAGGFAIDGNIAYLDMGGALGLDILDISNPANPQFLAHSDITSWNMHLSNDNLILGHGDSDIDILDISIPAQPTIAGQYDLPEYWAYVHNEHIRTDGRYAYVPYGREGMVIVDVFDPALPSVMADDITHRSGDVIVKDQYAYVTDIGGDYWENGLKIFDIRDIDSPSMVGFIHDGAAHAVNLFDHYALLFGSFPNMRIIDVADPANPAVVSSLDSVAHVNASVIVDDYAYLAGSYILQQSTEHFEIIVMDLSDALDPIVVKRVNLEKEPDDIAVRGDYLYVATNNMIQVYSLSDNPADPVFVTELDTDGSDAIDIYNDFLFAATGSNGLKVLDISDPISPVIVGSADFPGAYGVAVYYETVIVSSSCGIELFHCDLPTCCQCPGDANYDGKTDVGDAVTIIDYVFRQGSLPMCPPSADANNDCSVNVADAVTLINYIFKDGSVLLCGECE